MPVDDTAAGFLAIMKGYDSWTFLKSRSVDFSMAHRKWCFHRTMFIHFHPLSSIVNLQKRDPWMLRHAIEIRVANKQMTRLWILHRLLRHVESIHFRMAKPDQILALTCFDHLKEIGWPIIICSVLLDPRLEGIQQPHSEKAMFWRIARRLPWRAAGSKGSWQAAGYGCSAVAAGSTFSGKAWASTKEE